MNKVLSLVSMQGSRIISLTLLSFSVVFASFHLFNINVDLLNSAYAKVFESNSEWTIFLFNKYLLSI